MNKCLKNMKKISLLVLGLAFAGVSFAQSTVPGFFHWPAPDGENVNSMVIPKEYAFNKKPLLTFTSMRDPSHIMVYDENIELVKTFDIDDNKVFNYTLTYQTEAREVTSVTEEGLETEDLDLSFGEWLEKERSRYYYSSIKAALNVTRKENGDSVISIDYAKVQDPDNCNEEMYFGYSYFGMKYPKLYWIASGGNMCQCRTSYSVTYSDWKPVGETEEKAFSVRLPHIYLYNLNLDNGGGTNGTNGTYFEISQTLFNQDEDYEYLIPKLALVAASGDGSNDGSANPSIGENIQVSRSAVVSEKSELAAVGFQVVSSAGNVVREITFEDGFSFRYRSYARYALITIGGNRYLTFYNGSATVFYKIDSQTSSIKKVRVAKGSLFVEPAVMGRNATISVSLGDTNEKGSDILLTSASGQGIKSVHLPAGQTQTNVTVNVPSGLYCVSRLQGGMVEETKKIVVR